MNIGIIGYGNFGKFISKYLIKHFQVFVYDKKNIKQYSKVKISTLQKVASQDVVIIAVGIRNFEEVLKSIKPYVRKNSLVIDVCSVKEYPVGIMKRYLPRYVNILSTHPLFGPDSVRKGLKGNRIVVYPVRMKKEYFGKIKTVLSGIGLEIIELNPAEHDKIMAHTQMLMHLIARSLLVNKNEKNVATTENFQKLAGLFYVLMKDSNELFCDMIRYNRYSSEAYNEFLKKTNVLFNSCK